MSEGEVIKCSGKNCPIKENCRRFSFTKDNAILTRELFYSAPYNHTEKLCMEFEPQSEQSL